MILYRIVKCSYANDLSGAGARLFGGRWNRGGKPALYMASSCSLAVLEVLFHLPPLMVPDDYCLLEIEVPANSITGIEIEKLPSDWKDISPPFALKYVWDNFLRKQAYLLMKIPSSIVPMEYNYLLNVQPPAINRIKVLRKQPFNFNERLSYPTR